MQTTGYNFGASAFRISINSLHTGWTVYLHLIVYFLTSYSTCAAEDFSVAYGVEVPSKGEVLTIGTNYTIRWKADYFEATDRLDLVLQNADSSSRPALPIPIEQMIYNTGSYVWKISDRYRHPEGYHQILIFKYEMEAISDVFVLQNPQSSQPDNVGKTFDASVDIMTETRTLIEYALLTHGSGSKDFYYRTETTTRMFSSTTFLALTGTGPRSTFSTLTQATIPSSESTQEPWEGSTRERDSRRKEDAEATAVLGTILFVSLLSSVGIGTCIYKKICRKRRKTGNSKSPYSQNSGVLSQAQDDMVSEDPEYFPKTRVIE